jgi:hypothetical protein
VTEFPCADHGKPHPWKLGSTRAQRNLATIAHNFAAVSCCTTDKNVAVQQHVHATSTWK